VVMAVRADFKQKRHQFSAPVVFAHVLPLTRKDLAAVFFKPRRASGRFDARVQLVPWLPILNEASGALECVPGGSGGHGEPHGVRGRGEKAVAAIAMVRPWSCPAPVGNTARFDSTAAPLRKDLPGWSSASKELPAETGLFLSARCRRSHPYIGKSKSPAQAAVRSLLPRLPTS